MNLEQKPALQMEAFSVIPGVTSEEEQMEDALDTRAFTNHSEIDGDGSTAEAAKTDPTAFGELYERYYHRVYRYVYHRVGTYAEAEDITSVAFMKALEGLPSYESRRNGFAPWLFRITRNCVVDHYRRRKQQSPLEDGIHLAGDGDPVGH